MTDEVERFSWGKMFSGFFNPLNIPKALALGFHMILIIVVLSSLVIAGIWIKSKLKRKPVAQPVTITTTSGAVHNSQDDIKKKIGLINLW